MNFIINKMLSAYTLPGKYALYITLLILFSQFLPGCSESSSKPEYFSFWKDYPNLFGPEKWYKESDKTRAEKDRLLEAKLAELFRKENLIPSDGAKAFLEQFERAALAQILFQSEIKTKIRITEKDLKLYYDVHPDQFFRKESVDIGHIFIEAPQNAPEEHRNPAQRKIQAAHDELLSGASFEDVARKYSEAESASSGGRAGRLPRGQAPLPIEQTAFSLQPGEISPVLKTEHGFHIIKVFSHYPEKQFSFEEVNTPLEIEIRRNMEQTFLVSYIKNIWDSASGSHIFYDRALEQPTSATLVLEWEGRPYTYSDLQSRAKQLKPPVPPEKWSQSLPMLLQGEILARQAMKMGLNKAKACQVMNKWVENYVLAEEYMKQKVDTKITFTSDELRNYYNQNRERYFELEKSRALVLEYFPELSESPLDRHQEISDAKNLLLEVFQDCITSEQFREKAESFQKENQEKVKIYDTGLIVPAKAGRIYDMAISKIEPGKMSDPIEDKDGVMLIFCLEKTPFRYLPFKEAEGKVKRDLLAEKCAFDRRKLKENL